MNCNPCQNQGMDWDMYINQKNMNQNQQQNMNNMNQQQKMASPYSNVINRYYYQDVAVPVNYHTHVVNNCVKRYHPVPCCTYSEETVYLDDPCCGCQQK